MKHYTDDDIIDYLHHQVSDAIDAQIHAHLALCGDCRDRFDAEASLSDLLRSSARATERELPPMLLAQVWAQIRSARPSLLDRVRAFVSPAFAVPMAAALALLLYFGVPVLRSEQASSSPTVAAAYYFEEHAAEALQNPLSDHLSTSSALASGSDAPVARVNAPLIDAADAATLDDVAASRE